MIVSGTESLPDWKVRWLWPFTDDGWVYPMIAWGDPGLAIVFVAGMFSMLRWRTNSRSIATGTLLVGLSDIVLRGTLAR